MPEDSCIYKQDSYYRLPFSRVPSIDEVESDKLLLSWNEAIQGNKTESIKYLKEIPSRYQNLKYIQNIFLQCYFDAPETEVFFDQLLNREDNAFSRYNFFLANYLFYKDQNTKAKKIIDLSRENNNSNLLLKQAENFIKTKKEKKIKRNSKS